MGKNLREAMANHQRWYLTNFLISKASVRNQIGTGSWLPSELTISIFKQDYCVLSSPVGASTTSGVEEYLAGARLNIPIVNCLNIPVVKYSVVWIFQLSIVWIFQLSIVWIFQLLIVSCVNIPIVNFKLSEYSTCQFSVVWISNC